MGETNNEKSNLTTSKAAAKEVTKPANKITPAARMLQHILSSRSLLIMRQTMILEALNQAENEAEAKVEAALARKDELKSDKADVNNGNDKDSNKNKNKGKGNDNDNPPPPPPNPSMSASDCAESPFAAVQVDEVNQAQAAIRSLQRHEASVQAAARESPSDVQQNLAAANNIPPMAAKAPMAPKATTSGATRSGRVVKPNQKAREVNQAADNKKATEAATRTRTRTKSRRGGKGGGTRSKSAPPPAAALNMRVTRSGRVVKPRYFEG
ncbi:hypothetical protein B0T13DRAFT_539705 [Neurospora crassa]|nr:hypothetical protein B0T13DRAFT_539705 [Neurospora crassa]